MVTPSPRLTTIGAVVAALNVCWKMINVPPAFWIFTTHALGAPVTLITICRKRIVAAGLGTLTVVLVVIAGTTFDVVRVVPGAPGTGLPTTEIFGNPAGYSVGI